MDIFEESTGVLKEAWSGANTPAKGFGKGKALVGVAVDDSTGDVYVADNQDKVIDRFSSTGEYQCQWATPKSDLKSMVASGGDLYVVAPGGETGGGFAREV